MQRFQVRKQKSRHSCMPHLNVYLPRALSKFVPPPPLHPLQTFHPIVDNNFFFFTGFDIRIPPTVNLQEFEDKLNKWRSEAGADVTYKFFQVIEPRYEIF